MELIVACSIKEGTVWLGFNCPAVGLTHPCNAGALSLRKKTGFGGALEQLGHFPGAGLPGVFRGGDLGLCQRWVRIPSPAPSGSARMLSCGNLEWVSMALGAGSFSVCPFSR